MYTPFVPQFYKMTTLDPRPRSSTRSTQKLCDYACDAGMKRLLPYILFLLVIDRVLYVLDCEG